MSNLFWLNDAQMARLEPFFPKSHGKPRVVQPEKVAHRSGLLEEAESRREQMINGS